MCAYKNRNIDIGSLLENPVKNILSRLDYTVFEHGITEEGLDIEACKGKVTINIECLNWYGGYIHPKRFLSLIKNLSKCATYKFLICCGVKPSKEQYRILNAMHVNIIHYKNQILRSKDIAINHIRNKLYKIRDVITNITNTVNYLSIMSLFVVNSLFSSCEDKVCSGLDPPDNHIQS
jgi:hypothetical protein